MPIYNFSWTANPEPDVTTYRIYCGTASGVYDDIASPKNMGKVTSGSYDATGVGPFYFALTASTDLMESAFSDELMAPGGPPSVGFITLEVR